MRKTRILIASLLKPVNDTRMFEKVGQSLEKLPNTEIHIAGFSTNVVSNSPTISFHPIFSFKRLSLGRLTAQWKYYKLLLQLKPEVIIPNTYELLPVTLLYRIFYSVVILYDVRENYFANIRYQPTFPKALRRVLANAVRLVEKFSGPFITHFFLAEKAYAAELPFIKNKFTILENKFIAEDGVPLKSEFLVKVPPTAIRFLYSGTISEIYGIWEAIELVSGLHKYNNAITLTIIGYCTQEETYENLIKVIHDRPFIWLIGGNDLVPHNLIVEQIRLANVGLLPYRLNRSTQNCLPTKLFEYLANGLPVIIPENNFWKEIVEKYKAGFSINYHDPQPENILNRLNSDSFYSGGIPADVFWTQEEAKLLHFFKENILKE